MSTLRNPVAYHIVEAQRIILAASGERADTRKAIADLRELMCTIEANKIFLEAGVFSGVEFVSAAAPAAQGNGGQSQ